MRAYTSDHFEQQLDYFYKWATKNKFNSKEDKKVKLLQIVNSYSYSEIYHKQIFSEDLRNEKIKRLKNVLKELQK